MTTRFRLSIIKIIKAKRKMVSKLCRKICGGSIKDGYYHLTRGYTRIKDRG